MIETLVGAGIMLVGLITGWVCNDTAHRYGAKTQEEVNYKPNTIYKGDN